MALAPVFNLHLLEHVKLYLFATGVVFYHRNADTLKYITFGEFSSVGFRHRDTGQVQFSVSTEVGFSI